MRNFPHTSLLSPIDDESGYGILCRMTTLMGFQRHADMQEYLHPELSFSKRAPLKPQDISVLAIWASSLGISPTDTANRFSNWPLYRPFTWARFDLGIPEGDCRFGPLWWRPLGIESKRLKSCPKCTNEQYEKFGFATWLRSQNLAEVSACFLHNTKLIEHACSRDLLPPIYSDEYIRSYERELASNEEVFHARYVRCMLDSNLSWIPHSLQQSVVHGYVNGLSANDWSRICSELSPLQRFSFMSSRDSRGSNLQGYRYMLKLTQLFFQDCEDFRRLHQKATKEFKSNFVPIGSVVPGLPLVLQRNTLRNATGFP